MFPWANGQGGVFARVAQGAVVAQLPGQENIIPATDQIDWGLHLFHGCLKTACVPVLRSWLRLFKPLLEKRDTCARGKCIDLAQWEMQEDGPQGAAGGKQQLLEQIGLFLMGHQVYPGEDDLQGVRSLSCANKPSKNLGCSKPHQSRPPRSFFLSKGETHAPVDP